MFANHWNLNGRLGVFYASEDKDSYVEHTSGDTTFNSAVSQNGGTTELGQFSADARLGYLFDMIEPYALAGLDFDFTKDEGTLGGLVGFDGTRSTASHSSFDSEDFGARFGGGLNLRLGSNVTGGIEAYTVEFRDDYEEVTATAGLRVNF